MIKNDRITRLLIELPWLILNRNTSLDNFCHQFGLSRDEAIKDLSLLTYVGPGKFGGELVDIQYDDENISVIDSQGFNKPLKLNKIEAVLLLLGVRNLREISNDKQEILDLDLKLSSLIEKDIVNENHQEEYRDKKNRINDSIARGKQILIHYVDSNLNLTSERSITPIEITALNSKEYLTAIDNNSKQKRTFRLDRIIEVDLIPINGLQINIGQSDTQGEKVKIFTSSWNASSIFDLNIPYTVLGDQLIIEIELIEPQFLMEIILRLDTDIKIDCSEYLKNQLKNILKDRIDSVS